jgi:hypothetical protein
MEWQVRLEKSAGREKRLSSLLEALEILDCIERCFAIG